MNNEEFSLIQNPSSSCNEGDVCNYVIKCYNDEFLVKCIEKYETQLQDITTDFLKQEIDGTSRQEFFNYLSNYYNEQITESTIVSVLTLRKVKEDKPNKPDKKGLELYGLC